MPSKQNKNVQKSSSALQKLKKKVRLSGNRPLSQQDKIFAQTAKVAVPRPVKFASGQQEGGLSKCALKYALAIADPFNPAAQGACIPSFPSPPSHKVTAFARYTATVGTGLLGFMCICPSLASDAVYGYYTTAAYTQTSAFPLSADNTASTGVQRMTMSNLPYNLANIATGAPVGGSKAYGRIVSVGLRISYIGTTLNESGYYTILASPTHENTCQRATTPGDAGGFANAQVCCVTRRSCEASLYPVNTVETNYTEATTSSSYVPYIYPYSSNDATLNGAFVDSYNGYSTGSCPLMVLFTGVAGSQFLVELVQHCEYSGLSPSALLSQTDVDHKGFEIVSTAAERLPYLKNSRPDASPTVLMKEAIQSVMKATKPIAIAALTNIGLAMLT